MTAGLEKPSNFGAASNSISAFGHGGLMESARGPLNVRWAVAMNENIRHLGAGNQGARDQ